MVSEIINKTLKNENENLDSMDIAEKIYNAFDESGAKIYKNAEEKTKKKSDEIEELSKSENKDKDMKIARKKASIEETKMILDNQQKAINTAKENVDKARKIGCETKKDFTSIIQNQTEYNSTKNPNHKEKAEQKVSSFEKGNKPKTSKILKKTNPFINNVNSSKGFTNIVIILLIIAFAMGVAIGVACMIYKNGIG